ncbi:tight junction protein ZO-1 isoform X4 [Nematostella vectensis]|uniref:tight junction protein ZO-1 isoform X4 n=1 Tax=Nematostella vectensis TaxID=45351 RepID=UPI002076F938|nr:tight junction protein ZO-1 isoform X4 [Nematostella vectensis]
MAALQPYQRVLLENRDILLSDLRTDDVIPLLYLSKVLNQKEVDEIEIGRTSRERIESLLDVLHYKGESGFREFCKALDETFPYLADRLSKRESQSEKSDRSYGNKEYKGRYSSSRGDQSHDYRDTNGGDINDNYRRSEEREERSSMRGEESKGEYIYAKPDKRPRDRGYDRERERRDRSIPRDDRLDSSRRSRHEDERSHSSHQDRHERESDRHSSYSHESDRPRKAIDAVVEPAEDYIWEKQTIVLEKANANQGFGIAVSGGKDNPHYKTGDTSIVVSDIVKGSPADGLLRVNDVICQVNEVNVDKCYHSDAVQALKDSGFSARLIIKRKKAMPTNLLKKDTPQTITVTLHRTGSKGYGFSLANRLYIKEVDPTGIAFYEGEIDPGDIILKINDKKADSLKLRDAIDEVRNSKDQLELVIVKTKGENLSLSTRSLPSAFRNKGFKKLANGFPDERDKVEKVTKQELEKAPELPPRRYSDPDASRPDDKDGGMMQSSWRRLGGPDREDDRASDISRDREEREKRDREDRDRRDREDREHRERKDRERERRDREDRERRDRDERDRRDREDRERRDREDRERRDREDRERERREREDRERREKEEFDKRDRERREKDDRRPREDDRDRVRGRREEHVPKPAEVSRTQANMDLSALDSWDASTPRKVERNTSEDYLRDQDTRSIRFSREGKGIGIQVQGGNKHGIFVAGVREGNPAHRQGLRRGDKILMANDIDFKDITREEAVLILLSLGDEVSLLYQPRQREFERNKDQPGDDFFIKDHFDYEAMEDGELAFKREEVFHVTDTMYKGTIGSWYAGKVDLHDPHHMGATGVIPNKCRAEQLATVRRVVEDKTPKKEKPFSTNSLKRGASLRRKHQFVSTDKLDMDSFVAQARDFKLPAYERVHRKHPGFVRPVVLLGPLADIAIDKLLMDQPHVYAVPTAFGSTPGGKNARRTLSYAAIKEVVDKHQHCLLDIAPDEVERLNYCQLYPIVIHIEVKDKNAIKELRTSMGQSKESAKHIKKLFDDEAKLKKKYTHLFTTSVTAGTEPELKLKWMNELKDKIRDLQDGNVWASETEFEEHEGVEFNRRSMAFDYESNLDSPTTRSSISRPPEEDLHPERPREDEPYTSYNGPQVEYRDRERDRDRDRERDRERDRDRDREPYDGYPPEDIDRASRPGYKPSGNVVQVLPPSQDPGNLRQSLRKTRPSSEDYTDRNGDYPIRDGYNPAEAEIKQRADNLRKVEQRPEVFDRYDQEYGVKVSDLWTIDNESRRRDKVAPVEVIPVQSTPVNDLQSAPEPKPYRFEPATKPRNVVIDRSGKETVAHTSYYPTRVHATVRQVEAYPSSEPEIRAQVVDRTQSAPSYKRAEVTIPVRRDSKGDRQRKIYTSDAYTARPYSSEQPPPRPTEPDNYFKLSRAPPEPRPGSYRSEYIPDPVISREYRSEVPDSVVTSDFESLEDDTQVVATARGIFTHEGGVLSSEESGVSIFIPEGAIPKGVEQEIYFKVCKENNIMPPLDTEKGETLLSPLVMCGPHGTKFLKSVELRLPHCAAMTPDGWSFALKSSDTPTGMPTQWRNVSLPGQEHKDKCQVDPNSVSVLVDHFSSFSLAGEARSNATKRMVASVFAQPPMTNSEWLFHVVLADNMDSARREVQQAETACGRLQFSPFVPIDVHGDAKDVRVQLRDIADGWISRSACKKYIEFQDTWEAYLQNPTVNFVVHDRARGRVPNVCEVEVWQEGHEREAVILDVCTEPRQAYKSKMSNLDEYVI